ncbi:hypothetical protein C8Q80DRAFT_1130076 [Daedaleopsis nitida]|nr:hypothetical protein C8Q80DRAFT_1130076 [Daedaleopsis nitida]
MLQGLRTARHGVPPAITLDFLCPSKLRCRCRSVTDKYISTSTATSRLRRTSFATQPPPSSSSKQPDSIPAELLTEIPTNPHALSTLTNAQLSMFNNLFPRLRAAFDSRTIARVLEVWSALKTGGILAFFGPAHYDICSRLVEDYCRKLGQETHLEHWEQSVLDDIALAVAGSGATDGLRALMLLAVKHNHPQHALTLYDQYLESLRDKGLLQDIEPPQFQEPSSKDTTTLPPAPSPIRDEVLLSAIVAYARLDAFEDALSAYLAAHTRISPTTVEDFIPSLPVDLQQKVGDYARRLDTASLISQPEALTKHLANLTRDSATHSLERLYSAAIAGTREPHAWLAVKPSELTSPRVVLLPHFFWSSFLKSFLACRRTDLAERLWDDMLNLSVVPEIATWNALLDGYARNRAVDSVLGTWDLMASQRVKPDALSYRALIHGLCLGAKYEAAQRRFEAFQKEFIKPEAKLDHTAILAVYNTLIYGFLFASKYEYVSAVLERMEANGPKPDIVTFNTFLRYHARKGDLKAMASILQKLEVNGVRPDVYTFSTLLSAMLKIRPDADRMMINFMKKNGVPPDTVTLTAVIDNQLQERTPEGFKAAMDLLSKMERNEYENAEPNAVTYTSVITAINHGRWLERSVAKDQSRRIWERMKDRGITPIRPTYNTLIKAALDSPGRDGVEDAMAYYRDMLKTRVHLGNDTWYILLRGLMDKREWGLAHEVAKDMRKMKADHPPRSL